MKEKIFESWAPSGGRWSPWVKPVLFACMHHQPPDATPDPAFLDTASFSVASQETALVLDLPGPSGVWLALALARQGFRPVPLYNAVPSPSFGSLLETGATTAVVDVQSIASALWHGAAVLNALALGLDAPPTFLLDANRRGEGVAIAPGRFDNRSISFTTDFPSANFLLGHGIRRVVLVQSSGDTPQPDLAHTLRRWQEGGIGVELYVWGEASAPVPITVAKPSGFGALWQRAMEALGLRRHGLGGYGGFVPTPSAG